MVGRVVVINNEVPATGLKTGYFEVWAENFFRKEVKRWNESLKLPAALDYQAAYSYPSCLL